MIDAGLPAELAATDWGAEPGHGDPEPAFADVEAAADVIAAWLTPTPLIRHPLLNERAGCDLWVKLENAQPVGSFKIRGTLNFLAGLSPEVRARGLVTATRGNFGQSLARAAALYGAQCTIFVPRGNNPGKNEAMRATGAQLMEQGHDFDAAWDAAARYARQHQRLCVHPARHQAIVAGQGTVALEMIRQVSRPFSTLIVPVGGGSLAAGTALVARKLSPATRIIAVQAENAPAFHHAWHSGENRAFAAAPTIADGLASRVPVSYTMSLLRALVDDFITVTEAEIEAAIRLYLETVHQLAEGGGAPPVGRAGHHRARGRGPRGGGGGRGRRRPRPQPAGHRAHGVGAAGP
ncbi:MAG: threonine/serine dehydratase, partial [Gammaproteobacteria bacterium]|nr:threonine/serine dehydratase [Gammaproteobacteria bacterium]